MAPEELNREDARGTPPGKGVITPAHGGRIGNPRFEPTMEQRLEVRNLAKIFPPQAQRFIAFKLGISEDTLTRHFRDDLDIGRADLLAAVASQYINRALDAGKAELCKGDARAQEFIMARLGGWTQRVEVTGKGGRPIETVDLTRLSADQLEEYGRLSAIAEGLDPDAIIVSDRD